MTKKTRLIILFLCVACFFVASPIIVAYSMGYRFDFETRKITETGGIYVRTFPAADQIIIDSKNVQKPGMFSNAVFVQSLLPKSHTVLTKKEGYYDYSKTLPVAEKEVTKIENVLLFKKDITFEDVAKTEKFPPTEQTLPKPPPIKNMLAYKANGDNIIWFSGDGFLYQTTLISSAMPEKLNATPLKITKKGAYTVFTAGENVFLNNNGALLLLDKTSQTFQTIANSVGQVKISPDSKNLAYSSGNEIYVLLLADLKKKGLIYKAVDSVTDLIWLNSDYIIFSAGSKIIISEIDYRGNVNSVALPEFKAPKIYFDQQSGKLYVSTGSKLMLSEKITP